MLKMNQKINLSSDRYMLCRKVERWLQYEKF